MSPIKQTQNLLRVGVAVIAAGTIATLAWLLTIDRDSDEVVLAETLGFAEDDPDPASPVEDPTTTGETTTTSQASSTGSTNGDSQDEEAEPTPAADEDAETTASSLALRTTTTRRNIPNIIANPVTFRPIPVTTQRPTTTRTPTTSRPNTTPSTTRTTNRPPTTRPTTQSTARPTTTQRPTTQRPTTQTTQRPTTSTTTGGGNGNVPVDSKTVWVENFNTLDLNKWKLEDKSSFGVNEDQCYMANNVRVSGGKLILTGKNEGVRCDDRWRNQTSGMVRGKDFRFSPGQVLEFRVKLTPADSVNQKGLFPAVWSSSWAPGGWPLGGEFDYLEVMTANNPTKPFFSMHYQQPNGSKELQNKFFKLGENFTNRWHTIKVEYRRGDLRWFIDGNFAFKVDSANTAQGWPAPFDRTIDDLRINLALGGRPGPLDTRALGSRGATFEVDYMKISRL